MGDWVASGARPPRGLKNPPSLSRDSSALSSDHASASSLWDLLRLRGAASSSPLQLRTAATDFSGFSLKPESVTRVVTTPTSPSDASALRRSAWLTS